MKSLEITLILVLLGSYACRATPKEERTESLPVATPAPKQYVPKNSYGQSSLDSDAELEHPYGAILVKGGAFPNGIIANMSLLDASKSSILTASELSNSEDEVLSAFSFEARDSQTNAFVDPEIAVVPSINIGLENVPDGASAILVVKNSDETKQTFYVDSSEFEVTQDPLGNYLVSIGSVMSGNFSAALVVGVSNETLTSSFTAKPTSGVVTRSSSLPTNGAVSLGFTDTSLLGGFISGSLSIVTPAIEDFKQYYVYWGSSPSVKLSTTPISQVTKTGSNLSVTIPSNTAIPSGATHLLVYSRNANGEIPSGVSIAIVDKSVPVNTAVSVAFSDTDTTAGQVGGTVNITKATNESSVTHYVLYWGSSSTAKLTEITSIAKTGSNLSHSIAADTAIPSSPAATHLLVFTENLDGEMSNGVSIALSDNSGPTSQRIFVTSGTYGSDFGGFAQADYQCSALASIESLGGTWKAIISNDSTSAKDRITISGPVVNMNSETVADNSADFWDGSLDNPVGYDEGGNVRNVSVWTGTQSNGTKHPWDNCDNWGIVGPAFSGASGGSNQVDNQWLEGAGSTACTVNQSFYCIDRQ